MENKEIDFSEEWIKLINEGVPESEYIIINFIQDSNGVKISLNGGDHIVEIVFDGIPVLIRSAVEGLRMRTWGDVQLKYNNKFIFRKAFLFEVKKSALVKWCIQESCGFYEESQLRHYCIVTSEEMIDVISTFEPTVQKLK